MTTEEMDELDLWLAENGGIPKDTMDESPDPPYIYHYINDIWYIRYDNYGGYAPSSVRFEPSRNREQAWLLLEPYLEDWTITTTRYSDGYYKKASRWHARGYRGDELQNKGEIHMYADTEELALALLAKRLIEWRMENGNDAMDNAGTV